jgi:molybdopterin synthase catalytic subunit
MFTAPAGSTWVAVDAAELPVGAAYEWAIRPECGAVVLFSGVVRDHAEGRSGVEHLTYEAYDDQAVRTMKAICEDVRRRWPAVARIALLHRTGRLEIGESSVVVVTSSPHRAEAFEAARHAIDTLKTTVPIWKHEVWADGADWGTGAAPVEPVAGGRP